MKMKLTKKGSLELSMNTIVVIILSVIVMAFGFVLLSSIFDLQEVIIDTNTQTEFEFNGLVGIQKDSFEVFEKDSVIINFGIKNKNPDLDTNNFTIQFNKITALKSLNSIDGELVLMDDNFKSIITHTNSDGDKDLHIKNLDFGKTIFKKIAFSDMSDVAGLSQFRNEDYNHYVFEFLVCPVLNPQSGSPDFEGNVCDISDSVDKKKHRIIVTIK